MHSKSADSLTETVKTVISLVFGDDAGSANVDAEDSMQVASAPTLSRATYKLDLLHMIMRRKHWDGIFAARKRVGITLCHFVRWKSALLILSLCCFGWVTSDWLIEYNWNPNDFE